MNNVTDHPSVSLNVQTLLDERHTLKDRTAYQPSGRGQWIGQFRGARRGQGTEFDDLRHYSVGDDTRHIDWKASARTNVVHTRLYREEREYRTILIVDMRDVLFTGTTELQAVRLCRLAARLLWQANDGGSRTQVLIVTDDGLGLSESGAGHKFAIDACALMAQLFASRQARLNSHTNIASTAPLIANADDALLFLPKQSHASGYQTVHLEQVAEWMLQQTGKHATVFWISAFDHCGKQFDQHISLLSQHSHQVAIVIDDDVMNTGLPPGHYHYQMPSAATLPADASPQNIIRKATLNRKASNKIKNTLKKLKHDRDLRLSELMMPLFHLEQYGENLIASLRHQGYLP
jgi:hypothetical protein